VSRELKALTVLTVSRELKVLTDPKVLRALTVLTDPKALKVLRSPLAMIQYLTVHALPIISIGTMQQVSGRPEGLP
jgi:hypothetical protein